MNSKEKDVETLIELYFGPFVAVFPECKDFVQNAFEHAWDLGRISKLQDNGRMKLTEEKVREIRELLDNGKGVREVARDYEIAPKTVRDLRDRKTWRYVE